MSECSGSSSSSSSSSSGRKKNKTTKGSSRGKSRRVSLEFLLENVDLACGVVTIGFMPAQHMANGQTEQISPVELEAHERRRQRLINAQGSFFSRLLPADLQHALVDNFTSAFFYTHCEIAFFLSEAGKANLGEDSMLAVQIVDKGCVKIFKRKFHDAYEWYNVDATKEEIEAMLFYCHSIQGKPFAHGAMARVVVNPGKDERESYFCSYLTAAILEFLPHPHFHLNRPNALSVDDLHGIVSDPFVGKDARSSIRVTPCALKKLFM